MSIVCYVNRSELLSEAKKQNSQSRSLVQQELSLEIEIERERQRMKKVNY